MVLPFQSLLELSISSLLSIERVPKTLILTTPPRAPHLLSFAHRYSIPPFGSPNCNCPHSMAIDRDSATLDGDPKEDGSDGGDSFSEDDGSAMSDDKEPNDLMTLDQYQEEVHHEALIKKGSHTGTPSQKKGRLEISEPSS